MDALATPLMQIQQLTSNSFTLSPVFFATRPCQTRPGQQL
jgi:hypothetical protein